MRRLGPALLIVVLLVGCPPRRGGEVLEAPVVALSPRPLPIAIGARVPRTFVPAHYAAELTVGDGTFLTGTMVITGDITMPTDVIWLHGSDLEIESAIATHADTTIELEARATGRGDGAGRFLTLSADAPLAAGRWVVTIAYRAKIDDKGKMPEDQADREKLRMSAVAAGAFREWVDGEPYLFTMSEPMDARRIFPCIDEPDRKVPWQLTLDVRETYVAASNTHIVRETFKPGGRKRVEFAPTLPLPSYLIAFAVGPFAVVDAGTSASGIPIRILTQRNERLLASWAKDATAPIVDATEAWFGIPLAYRKLDLVAVPVTGPRWVAMENPGLVTVLGSTLRDATDDAHGDEWRYVVVHELVHQWFGNLVTPAWWDDIWLNESFAVWLTAKLTVQLSRNADPGYGTERVNELTISNNGYDAATVRVPPSDLDEPSRLARYFGGRRGAHVLAMFEAFVGPEGFQRAVRDYVRAHAHGTVTTADFSASLDAVSGKPLSPILASYLDQPGAPDITVAVYCERDRSRIEITRFGSNGSVPVCIAYDDAGTRVDQCLIVAGTAQMLALPTGTCPRWVLPNAGGRGLYSTQWNPGIVDGLINTGWPLLTPLERTAILGEITRTLDSSRTLSIVSSLLASPHADAVALSWGAAVLRPYVRMVPDVSRRALFRWVTDRYLAGVKDKGFTADLAAGPQAEQLRARSLDLLAAVRDRTLSRQAMVRVGANDIPEPFRGAQFDLATLSDGSLPGRYLSHLSTETDAQRRWEMISHLSRLESITTVVRMHPAAFARLSAIEQRRILGAACTPQDRDLRVAIINQHVEVRDRFRMAAEVTIASDRCIAERARLEPAFRAWLGPKRR